MILKLLLKDLIAYKNQIFFRTLIPMLFVTNIFNIRFYEWDVYFMMVCMVISASFSSFYFLEKKNSAEQLTLSLPTTRTKIVLTRYMLSIFIAAIGIFLFYLNAYLAEFIYANPTTHFLEINNVKVLLIALFFLSIVISIFLPAVFGFRVIGMTIMFAIAVIAAIFFVATMFMPWAKSFNPQLPQEQLVQLSLIIITLTFVSFILSIQIYKKRDL